MMLAKLGVKTRVVCLAVIDLSISALMMSTGSGLSAYSRGIHNSRLANPVHS